MPVDLSKYKIFADHVDQTFRIYVGSSVFEAPRMMLRWEDGKEIFLYFESAEMAIIHNWAASYVK